MQERLSDIVCSTAQIFWDMQQRLLPLISKNNPFFCNEERTYKHSLFHFIICNTQLKNAQISIVIHSKIWMLFSLNPKKYKYVKTERNEFQ